jgi:hypothetical protein
VIDQDRQHQALELADITGRFWRYNHDKIPQRGVFGKGSLSEEQEGANLLILGLPDQGGVQLRGFCEQDIAWLRA